MLRQFEAVSGTRELRKLLSKNHREQMKGRAGGARMCVCGQGCGGTKECGEYALLLQDHESLTARVRDLEAALRHYADESNWLEGNTGDCTEYFDLTCKHTHGYEVAQKALGDTEGR
jgi:hypothetical protein